MFKVDERTPQKIGPVSRPAAAFFFCSTELFSSTCEQVMIIIPRSSVITKTSAPWASRGVPFGVFWKVEDEDMKSFPRKAILIEDV